MQANCAGAKARRAQACAVHMCGKLQVRWICLQIKRASIAESRLACNRSSGIGWLPHPAPDAFVEGHKCAAWRRQALA